MSAQIKAALDQPSCSSPLRVQPPSNRMSKKESPHAVPLSPAPCPRCCRAMARRRKKLFDKRFLPSGDASVSSNYTGAFSVWHRARRRLPTPLFSAPYLCRHCFPAPLPTAPETILPVRRTKKEQAAFHRLPLFPLTGPPLSSAPAPRTHAAPPESRRGVLYTSSSKPRRRSDPPAGFSGADRPFRSDPG